MDKQLNVGVLHTTVNVWLIRGFRMGDPFDGALPCRLLA